MASSTTTSCGTQTGSDSTESKSPTPPSTSAGAPPIPHHINWVCCVCNEWTNHPTGTCLRLHEGLKLINYSWVACRHDKCMECVEVTEARWAERF